MDKRTTTNPRDERRDRLATSLSSFVNSFGFKGMKQWARGSTTSSVKGHRKRAFHIQTVIAPTSSRSMTSLQDKKFMPQAIPIKCHKSLRWVALFKVNSTILPCKKMPFGKITPTALQLMSVSPYSVLCPTTRCCRYLGTISFKLTDISSSTGLESPNAPGSRRRCLWDTFISRIWHLRTQKYLALCQQGIP
jgi:hypothetical protein